MIRVFDTILSSIAIVILMPLFIVVTIVLLLTGEHHVFYLQSRIGKGGRTFRLIKFVTMTDNSSQFGNDDLTHPDDPRVLPVGRVLRKWKINELPQFFNVLWGQMSLVGPRPQTPTHYNLYPPEVAAEIQRLRPGLSGVGSLVFRNEEELLERSGLEADYVHDQLIAPYKGNLEKWFSQNVSIAMYFKILILTAFSLIHHNANILQYFRGAPKPNDDLGRLLGVPQ